RRARARRRHRALERAPRRVPELSHGDSGQRPGVDTRLPGRGCAVPHSHRGAAHRLPRRGALAQRAGRPVLEAGPRSARDHAAHARLTRGQRRAVERPARRPGAGARADRPAAGGGGRRSGRRTVDQPGIGPTQRVAAAADGEPRRPRPRAHARSIVMQAMYLMVAAVVGMQHPVGPPVVVPARAHAQPVLEALNALDGLNVLDALDALDAVGPWDSAPLQDEQDPTDSLWRGARRAFKRGDYASAGKLYADLARRYPDATRAGDALYWAAFALYKNDDLLRARSLLFTQQERYAKAATLRDGYALLARVQVALAKQGDREAAEWINKHAQPADTGRARGGSCPGEEDDDDMRIAALKGLLQMDATNALPILKKVLSHRDGCSAGLRRKAVFVVSQKRGGETEDILLDVARNDPDSEVRQQAVLDR